MTLEQVYYIGQTIAVLAILGSLLAIFWQQRHTNKIARVQNAAELSAAYTASLRDIMNSAELTAIFRKVMFDNGSLTPVEATRILLYFNLMLGEHHRVWRAFENGLFDKETFDVTVANTGWYLTKPIFKTEWERCRATGLFVGPFADHIDSLIKTSSNPEIEPRSEMPVA